MKKREEKFLEIELKVEKDTFITKEIPYPNNLPFTMATDVSFKILKELGASAMGVYLSILKHRNVKNNQCFPSIATIAEESGLNEKTVKRALTKLCDNQFLIINSGMRGIASNYYFPQEWFYKYFNQDIRQKKASRRKGKKTSITEERKTKADLIAELEKTQEALAKAEKKISKYQRAEQENYIENHSCKNYEEEW